MAFKQRWWGLFYYVEKIMFLTWLLKILKSERGETPDTGTTTEESEAVTDEGLKAATEEASTEETKSNEEESK